MINYAVFVHLLACASECATIDDYISAWGGSVPMDSAEGVTQILSIIWSIGHAGITIRSISTACRIPMRQIAMRYDLPTRTVEAWSAGNRTPPEWQLPLLAYAVLSDYVGALTN